MAKRQHTQLKGNSYDCILRIGIVQSCQKVQKSDLMNATLGAHCLLLTFLITFWNIFLYLFFGNLKPILPKYVSSGSPIFFKMYFWLIGLEVGLVLIGDHLLCWFFLGILKLGAGSPVFFRISKRLIEGAIKKFQGLEFKQLSGLGNLGANHFYPNLSTNTISFGIP